ncbi:ABC transporter permease [Fulvivirga lutea]|uniref:ABC transporter permease n=1 Tax=Fulvivirga lutea TaxID=2810512 RepID=A0A974WIA6_9BACT|nr:ABC transporter permease [Fulvivirga lutea]QSE95868.1 ABC transporter permease [Fulvivirga lutea]
MMLRNYLKITLRNVKKDKWFSLINVIGLTIGIAGSLLIYIHINHELSYDNFHNDSDRLYRIVRASDRSEGKDYEPNVPYPLINSLHSDFTQFESATLYHNDEDATATIDGEKFGFINGVFADSSFFDVFNFKVLSGDPKKSLSQPNFIFLSESTAQRLFKDKDPIGRKLKLNNLLELEVVGLFEDIPSNTEFEFEYVVSYPSFSSEYFADLNIDSWQMSAEGFAFVKLKKGVDPSSVESQFKEVIKKYFSNQDAGRRNYLLQPLNEIHFDPRWNSNATNTTTLITIGLIGAFILLVGCVNFINLSTALAVRKSKEIGVRKTLGAQKFQLVVQFLGETFLVTLVSAILAVAIAERLIPLFNNYFNTELSLNVLQDYNVLGFVALTILIVTFLAGTYPAMVVSGFNPIKALKNNIHSQSASSLFMRKGLIVVQFIISQILIIGTIIISSQMDYFLNKPLGFEKDAVINVRIGENDEQKQQAFRERLLQNPAVKEVSFNMAAPISDNSFQTFFWPADQTDEQGMQLQVKPADIYYKDTYGIELLHGRWFSESDEQLATNIFKEDAGEKALVYILNETAVNKLGYANLEDAIGTQVTSGVGGMTGPIIGIVKDFHTSSLHEAIKPTAIVNFRLFYYNAGVKISMQNSRETIAQMKNTFEEIFPNEIFEYDFMDDAIADFYQAEQRAYNLLVVFSMLSIFISCLGLLGVISFVVAQKNKEVGVRKVLGASIASLVILFTKDFLSLVIIAFLIAAPIAWYFLDGWLNNFAYQIDMEVWFFAAGFILSAIITFITIGYQSLKAAISNPVNALKDE